MKQVYVIANEYPWPATTGGRSRMKHLLTFVSQIYGNVILVCPEPKSRLQSMENCDQVIFFSPKVRNRFASKLNKLPSMGLYYLNSDLPKIFESIALKNEESHIIFGNTYLASMFRHLDLDYSIDVSDLEVRRFKSFIRMGNITSRLASTIEWAKALNWEPKTLQGARVLICCSLEDQAKIAKKYTPPLLLSNHLFIEKENYIPSEGNNRVLCFGNWEYAPNSEGLNDFIENVWKRITKFRPQAKLVLAGRGSRDIQIKDSASLGIQMHGEYSELRDLTGQIDLIIFPTNHGGGQQLKVVEGLSHNRVCILSQHSLKSITNRKPKNAIACQSYLDFSDAILQYLENHELRRSIEASEELEERNLELKLKEQEFMIRYGK